MPHAPIALPPLGLGTYRLRGQALADALGHALDLGYRAIDTAQMYGNEADIGAAIAASPVDRAEIFLTTKLWPDQLAAARVLPSLKESLLRLGTDMVDLVLIHWPSRTVPLAETLGALFEAQRQGLAGAVGVSNFPIALLREALAIARAAGSAIATNQVEISPYLQNERLAAFARAEGVRLTAYMPLGVGRVAADPVLAAIGQRHGATAAQVALAWSLRRGHAVIPSSRSPEHLRDNLAALQLRLDDADMARIAALERGERIANPRELAPEWD